MGLTPLDIHHKEFRRSIRGYNEEEVDLFLDQAAEEFERIFKENNALKEQVESMNAKVKQYEGVESTLQKALFTAQQAADEVQDNAKKESDIIIKDAELKAKDIIQNILTEKQKFQTELSELKEAERDFREKFRGLLQQYMSIIDQVEKGDFAGAAKMVTETAVEAQAVAEIEVAPPAGTDDSLAVSSAIEAAETTAADSAVEEPSTWAAQEIASTEEPPVAPEFTPASELPVSDMFAEPKVEAEVYESHSAPAPDVGAPSIEPPAVNDVPIVDQGWSSGFSAEPDRVEPPKVEPEAQEPASEASAVPDFKVTLTPPPEAKPEAAPGEQATDFGFSPAAPTSTPAEFSILDEQPIPEFTPPQKAQIDVGQPMPEVVSSFFDDDLGVDEEEKGNSWQDTPPAGSDQPAKPATEDSDSGV